MHAPMFWPLMEFKMMTYHKNSFIKNSIKLLFNFIYARKLKSAKGLAPGAGLLAAVCCCCCVCGING